MPIRYVRSGRGHPAAVALLPAARAVRGRCLLDGRDRPQRRAAQRPRGRRRAMALSTLRHTAREVRPGACRVRGPLLLPPCGRQPAGTGPRRMAEPAERACRKRRQHAFDAGHPPVAPPSAHTLAESGRNLHGHTSGVALFEKGDSASLRLARTVRGQCRGDRCRLMALFGRRRCGVHVGRGRDACRAAECPFGHPPRQKPRCAARQAQPPAGTPEGEGGIVRRGLCAGGRGASDRRPISNAAICHTLGRAV